MNFPTSLSRLIVLDLETSGLDPSAHSILEIAAAPLDPARAEETFQRDVRHEWHAEWDPKAAAVHGLTLEEASSPRRYGDNVALDQFLDWVDDTALGDLPGRALIAGVNPRYDYEFLRVVAARADMLDRFNGLISHRTVDLHTLAVAYAAGRVICEDFSADNRRGLDGLHTDAIYELLGQAPEAKPHRALEGVRRESLALRELLTLLSNHQLKA